MTEAEARPFSMLSPRKTVLFTALYLVQGLPFGFFLFTYPLILRAQGLSLTKITFLSVVNLPWLLKFLWAPLVDRYFWPGLGRRTSWILPMQLGLAASLALTGVFAMELGVNGLIMALLVVNFFAATQDIAVDGLAVDQLSPAERGHGNAIQSASYKIGMLAGGFGLTFVLQKVGPQGCFYLMAACVVAVMPVLFLVQGDRSVGAAGEDAPPMNWGVIASSFSAFLRRPGFGWLLVFLLVVKAGDAVANPLYRLCLRDQGYTISQINWVMNLLGIVATLCGSLFTGFLMVRYGRLRCAVVALAGQLVAYLAWVFLASGTPPLEAVAVAAVLEHATSGMITVVVFTLMMDAVAVGAAAAQYTLLMSLHLGIQYLMGIPSGSLVDFTSYSVAFLFAGGLTLAVLGLLIPMRRAGVFRITA
jgi:MFS family permease